MARNRMGLANQNHVTCPLLLAMRVRVGVSACFWIDRGFAAGHKSVLIVQLENSSLRRNERRM